MSLTCFLQNKTTAIYKKYLNPYSTDKKQAHEYIYIHTEIYTLSLQTMNCDITTLPQSTTRNDENGVLNTKYAIARYILDLTTLTSTKERENFERNFNCSLVDTIKHLMKHYTTERRIYDTMPFAQIHKFYKESKKVVIANDEWRTTTKMVNMDVAIGNSYIMNRLENFIMPPLILGPWTVMHHKHKMTPTGLALPIYTLHGIDALGYALTTFVNDHEYRHRDVVTGINLKIEYVQNQAFYHLSFVDSQNDTQKLICFLDTPNLPSKWATASKPTNVQKSHTIDRVYVMLRNIEFESMTDIPESEFLQKVVHVLLSCKNFVYLGEQPYDLVSFTNLRFNLTETRPFTDQMNFWSKIEMIEAKYLILLQQMPLTVGLRPLTVGQLMSWINHNKIPSNMLVRSVNLSQRRYIKGDSTVRKLVYVTSDPKEMYIIDVTLGVHQKELPSLGPLIPPIFVAHSTFTVQNEIFGILQNSLFIGKLETIIFTSLAIKPIERFYDDSRVLRRIYTCDQTSINTIAKVYLNQSPVDAQVIFYIHPIKFVMFKYRELNIYAFMNATNEEGSISFNVYNVLLKMLFNNKHDLFNDHLDLGISIAHFIDYFSSSLDD